MAPVDKQSLKNKSSFLAVQDTSAQSAVVSCTLGSFAWAPHSAKSRTLPLVFFPPSFLAAADHLTQTYLKHSAAPSANHCCCCVFFLVRQGKGWRKKRGRKEGRKAGRQAERKLKQTCVYPGVEHAHLKSSPLGRHSWTWVRALWQRGSVGDVSPSKL